jgi:hypothetical protein
MKYHDLLSGFVTTHYPYTRPQAMKEKTKAADIAGPTLFTVLIMLSACATVRPEDQAAWVGVPVAALDTHPIFYTMPVVRTIATDGTEIRNYVNSRSVMACAGAGTIFSGTVTFATYNTFESCMQSQPTCNNIFYIKNGIVTAYTPIGSGGGRCWTDERSRPYFRGSTNY